MSGFISIIVKKDHYSAPFTVLCKNKVLKFKGCEKAIALVAGIAGGILCPIFGNIAAFYISSALIKLRKIKQIQSSLKFSTLKQASESSKLTTQEPSSESSKTITQKQTSESSKTITQKQTSESSKPITQVIPSSKSNTSSSASQTSFALEDDPELLKEIFAYLPQSERFAAQKVCKSWNSVMQQTPAGTSKESQVAWENLALLEKEKLLDRSEATQMGYTYCLNLDLDEETGEVINVGVLRRIQTNNHVLVPGNTSAVRTYEFEIGFDGWPNHGKFSEEACSLVIPPNNGKTTFSDTVAKEMLILLNYSSNLKWKVWKTAHPSDKYLLLHAWGIFKMFSYPLDIDQVNKIRKERLAEAAVMDANYQKNYAPKPYVPLGYKEPVKPNPKPFALGYKIPGKQMPHVPLSAKPIPKMRPFGY